MAKPIEVNDSNFDQTLKEKGTVLVDFWAEWCGPCKMVAPVLEEISRDYAGKLKVVKLNVDHHPLASSAYSVSSIPTLMLFKNGQPVERIVGALPKAALLQKLLPHLAPKN